MWPALQTYLQGVCGTVLKAARQLGSSCCDLFHGASLGLAGVKGQGPTCASPQGAAFNDCVGAEFLADFVGGGFGLRPFGRVRV